ncbi:MAG: hemolysin [Granulicatella sp.]|nr:MAG: hemolysin [Granulicatella sp.]
MKRQKPHPNKRNIITNAVVIAVGVTLLNTSPTFATVQKNVSANYEQTTRTFTVQDALKVSKGDLHSEDNLLDKSLYGEKPLDPEGDDDHDGIKNKDELYVYSKNGKEYLGYYSHPLLEDSDGDGLLDNEDDNKTKWYMTDRDAVLFMELSYRNDDYIKKILDHKNLFPYLYLERQEYKMMHNELAPFWKMKKSYHTDNGMDAVLFETKSDFPYLKDSSVQMLAIRGTKIYNSSDANDLTNDLVLFGGNQPTQVNDIRKVIEELANDSSITNLYITGHSLGGYLAQIAAVEAYQKYPTFYENVLKKVTTFNAPKIITSRTVWNAHNGFWDVGLESRKLALNGKIKHYVTDNDNVITPILQNDSDITTSTGNAEHKHRSRGYFESRMNEIPNFNIGKRSTLDQQGYRDPKLDTIQFIKKTVTPENSSVPSVDPLENIALGKRVSQSSTAFGGDASRAVDGKTDGDFGHQSVTHTNFQSKPWWQVDLDSEETIRQINIYNRTDTASNRLSNFHVILLDSFGNEIDRKRISSLTDTFAQIAIDYKKARYVRIELEGNNALSLAEVQVLRAENIAWKKQATQSSTAYGGNANRALDGNTNSSYSQNSITHTNFEKQAWWQVDLGRNEQVGLVRLFNRGDGELAKRLSNFDVILYNENNEEVSRQYIQQLTSNQLNVQFNGKIGRYVRVQLHHEHQALSLAEVEVFRHTPVKDTNIQMNPIQQPVNSSANEDKVLTIQHKGAYVARYTISWDEINTDKDGNETVRSQNWEGNGKNRTSGYVLNLPVKANMKNIRVKIEKATGLVWNWWKPIYDNTLVLDTPQRTITHWGTTLNSKISDQ